MANNEQDLNEKNLDDQLDGRNLWEKENGEGLDDAGVQMKHIAEQIHEQMTNLNPEEKFPAVDGWNRFQAALGEEHVPVVPFRKRNRKWMIAAAAAVLAAAAVTVLWINKPAATDKTMAGTTTGQPEMKTETVKLTLADGRVVELTDSAQLIDDAGRKILLDKQSIDYSTLPAEQSVTVSLNTIDVPRGQKARITLPDGTKVWLNAASSLKYPIVFNGATREVTLTGQGYFEVKRNEKQPFLLKTNELSVEVLGTAFDVEAYAGIIHTTLDEGSVRVNTAGKSLQLKPGQTAAFDKARNTLYADNNDARMFTAWKDGDLYFNNLSFKEIAERLEREYNCVFNFTTPSLATLHFTIDLPAPENIEDILTLIEKITPELKLTSKGNIVTVSSL